jgi:Protein of unknown function (DUF3618)
VAKNDELVDEIEQIRDRLADTVDALIDRTNPTHIARRSLTNLKNRFVEPDGSPRMSTIGPLLGGTVALVGVVVIIRRLVR